MDQQVLDVSVFEYTQAVSILQSCRKSCCSCGGSTAREWQALAGISASLREDGCPGKGRKSRRHPGNPGSGSGCVLQLCPPRWYHQLLAVSPSVFSLNSWNVHVCDPNPLPDFPDGNQHKHLRGKRVDPMQSLLVPAVFPRENGMSPSSFLQSSGKSPVPAAFSTQIRS